MSSEEFLSDSQHKNISFDCVIAPLELIYKNYFDFILYRLEKDYFLNLKKSFQFGDKK